MAMSMSEVVKLARNAGLSKDAAATAGAIAKAESGLNPRAHNTTGLDNSYGLWQINMYGSLGPDRRKRFGLASNDELFTPNTNARVMAALSNGGKNWTPWTTFTRGTYLRYLGEARNVASGSETVAPVGLSDTTNAIEKALTTLRDRGTWVRVGLYVGGMVALFIAIMKLTGDNKLSDVTKTVVKYATIKKV